MNKWTQWIRFIDKVGHHDAVIIVENIINHSAIDMICMDHVHTIYDIGTSLKQKYEIKISRLFVLNLSAWYCVIFLKMFLYRNLENNRIQFIPSNVFALNKQLRSIKLRGNPILSFGVNAFQGLAYLGELYGSFHLTLLIT